MNGKFLVYVTHFKAFASGREKWLRKVREVLKLLKSGTGLCCEWYHFRDEEQKSADSGELWEEYLSLIRDSSGPEQYLPGERESAVFYYGDPCPFLKRKEAEENDVIFQDPDIPSAFAEPGWHFPLFFVPVGHKLIYQGISRSDLLIMDPDTCESEYVSYAPVPLNTEKRAFHHAVTKGDWLYLIPFKAEYLARWHLKEKRWETFPLELKDEYKVKSPTNIGSGYFYQLIYWKERVYLLPFTYKAVIYVDLATGRTVHCADLKELFLKKGDPEQDNRSGWYMKQVFFHQYCLSGPDRVLIPSCHSNALLEYDLARGAARVFSVGEDHIRLCAITSYKGVFYILAMNEPVIYRWENDRGVTGEYRQFPEGFGKSMPDNRPLLFGRNECFRKGRYWYLFPARANMVCRMDLETGLISRLPEFDRYCQPLCRDDISFFDGSAIDGDLVYLWHKSGVMLRYDIRERTVISLGDPFIRLTGARRGLSSGMAERLQKNYERLDRS